MQRRVPTLKREDRKMKKREKKLKYKTHITKTFSDGSPTSTVSEPVLDTQQPAKCALLK
jgi:hypothetical protein